MSAIIVLLILLFLLGIWYFLAKPSKRMIELAEKIPGPWSLPILGNSLLYVNAKSKLDVVLKLGKKYGNIYRTWLGNTLTVDIADPEDIKVFMSSSKHIIKGDSYRLVYDWLGDGLITATGDIWKSHRKLLTPAFHFNVLEKFLVVFLKNSQTFIEKSEDVSNMSDVDIKHWIQLCSMDIICETAMGIPFNFQESNDTSYIKAVDDLTWNTLMRSLYPWLRVGFIFRMTNYGYTYHNALKKVRGLTHQVISGRRSQFSHSEPFNTNKEDGKKQRSPFLDLMLLNPQFSDKEIIDEVQTFLFAGHDTVTTALTFCIYELSRHQDIQEKATEEVKRILNKSEQLTISDFAEMKYLENVIKETLRMYTPVPIIQRKLDEDVKMPSGYTLPAGAVINIDLIRMHHREDLFPNPEEFNPERFENETNKHPFAYVPFSAGLRNCIGQKFAMLEMKVILSFLLKNYVILPSDKTQHVGVDMGVVLRPLQTIYIKLKKSAQ